MGKASFPASVRAIQYPGSHRHANAEGLPISMENSKGDIPNTASHFKLGVCGTALGLK